MKSSGRAVGVTTEVLTNGRDLPPACRLELLDPSEVIRQALEKSGALDWPLGHHRNGIDLLAVLGDCQLPDASPFGNGCTHVPGRRIPCDIDLSFLALTNRHVSLVHRRNRDGIGYAVENRDS